MTQAIIYARVASQNSNLDTKIDNLVNYCSNHKLRSFGILKYKR